MKVFVKLVGFVLVVYYWVFDYCEVFVNGVLKDGEGFVYEEFVEYVVGFFFV